jgi:hypothetical protein
MEHYLGKHGKLNTGVGHAGVVEGIQTASAWLFISRINSKDCIEWNNSDPGWENNYLLQIKLDQAQRACTFEQFKDSIQRAWGEERVNELSDEELNNLYKSNVQYQFYVNCPINLFEPTQRRYTENYSTVN